MMVRIKHRTDTDTITVNINGQVLIINQVWILRQLLAVNRQFFKKKT